MARSLDPAYSRRGRGRLYRGMEAPAAAWSNTVFAAVCVHGARKLLQAATSADSACGASVAGSSQSEPPFSLALQFIRRKSGAASEVSDISAADVHNACSVGDVETVRAWLDSGGDVNMQSKSQCTTPLAKAASKGQISVAQLLLQKGAIVQSRGRCGMTPLHEAAGSGKSNVSSSYTDVCPRTVDLYQLVSYNYALDTNSSVAISDSFSSSSAVI
eukprot:16522-Heterococcus_DN1.PRE.2